MSAALKPQHIETIFDYDLTQEEQQSLTLGIPKEKYLQLIGSAGLDMSLVALFEMRGDKENYQKHISRIDSDFVKFNVNFDALVVAANN